MSNTSTGAQYAWAHLEGEKAVTHRPLQTGDAVYDRDGQPWTFLSVSRKAVGNSTGRVAVSRPCADAYDNGHGGRECVHMWHRDGIERSEYFPSVFGLYLGLANGEEA
jgi:hypothetical protein